MKTEVYILCFSMVINGRDYVSSMTATVTTNGSVESYEKLHNDWVDNIVKTKDATKVIITSASKLCSIDN